MIIQVAKAILQSPSSVIPSARIRPGSVRRGRKGIGAKYQLTKITPAFLAYVAVIVSPQVQLLKVLTHCTVPLRTII